MKKYLLVLIVVLNTSFIEIPHHYWIGHAELNDVKNNWDITRVIEADNEKEALFKLDSYCKLRVPKGKYINRGDGCFYVTELKKEDILK